ncbi:MAG: aminotransferase class V-fold PLP-dependent enzyme [Hyphomicrobiaceae bacterium]|nr:aminotransferase class V-fold PLP-dependent enzyme [Hyphomicrobiaceae bacterium]
MKLNRGRMLTSMPGPSVIPERVLSAMHTAMPNIYEGALIDTSVSVFDELPAIAKTSGRAFMAISNGHGAWEMALTNTLCRGDHVLVLESGRFAIGWGNQANVLGAEIEVLNAPARGAIDPQAVEERLRADTDHKIKAVLAVQVDTASGVWNDIAEIGRVIRASGHPALFMVDCIASLGCVEYRMDDWSVDVTVGGSQKGLMVPPGLGIVWAGEKAMSAHKRADMRTPYWDWTARQSNDAHYLRYCGTAPIQHIYAMRTALDMITEEGLEAVWARHAVFADAVRAAVEAWSAPGGLEFNIIDPAHRSDSTTTVLTGSIDAERLCRVCEDGAGLTLGIGLGDFAGRAFRIGHMGHLNPTMVLGTLATIEAALGAMDAPVGSSGATAAARVVSDALKS